MDQKRQKQPKQEAIFRAALKVIKEHGFHRARMADIAAEAGISYGLVYHYFKNKEDLFEAILNRWWGGLFKLMDTLTTTDMELSEKLGQIIEYFLSTYQENPELVNIFITEISRSTTNLTGPRLNHFKKFMSLTQAVMEEGQEKGFLRSDFKARYLTYIFLGALETFVSAMVLVDQKIKGEIQKKKISDSILEVFLNGARKHD